MSPNGFETLLTIAAPHIGKRTSKFRDPAVQQIVLKLRYLAIGEFQQELSLTYRIGKPTVSKIVSETALVTFSSSRHPFVKVSSSKKGWYNITAGIEKIL